MVNYSAYVACLLLISSQSAPAEAWKDQQVSKWGPRYIPDVVMYPRYTSSLSPINFNDGNYGYRKPLFNPSWFIESMNPILKRQKEIRRQSTCVPVGEVCLFRGGLMGAALKRSCCDNATCLFIDKNFTCVSQSTLEELKRQITEQFDQEFREYAEK